MFSDSGQGPCLCFGKKTEEVAFKIIKRAGEMTQVGGLGFDSSSSNSGSQLSVTAVPTPLNPSENLDTTGSAFSK